MEKMSPEKKQAKMEMLQELMDMCQNVMGENVKSGMTKKVTVSAPDESSLKEGLEIAENLLPAENINPDVAEVDSSEGMIIQEPSELEATEKIAPDMDDEDDDIFAKKRKKSKMQELTSDEE